LSALRLFQTLFYQRPNLQGKSDGGQTFSELGDSFVLPSAFRVTVDSSEEYLPLQVTQT
jgi:hypothetical protein